MTATSTESLVYEVTAVVTGIERAFASGMNCILWKLAFTYTENGHGLVW
jgi:hypothetical protein